MLSDRLPLAVIAPLIAMPPVPFNSAVLLVKFIGADTVIAPVLDVEPMINCPVLLVEGMALRSVWESSKVFGVVFNVLPISIELEVVKF